VRSFEILEAHFGTEKVVDTTAFAKETFKNPFEYYAFANLPDPQPGALKYFTVKFKYDGKTYVQQCKEPNTSLRLLDPIFSVIIPTWNRGKFLIRAIDSILAQTFDIDRVEIIVIDDASTDDTALLMEKKCRENKITYIRIPHTGCCGLVRNFGIKIASGEYIAYLDSDDKYTPEHLQVVYDKYQETKALAVRTYSKFYVLKELPNGVIEEKEEEDFGKKLYNRWNMYPSCFSHRRDVIPLLKLDGNAFHTRVMGEDCYLWWALIALSKERGLPEETVAEKHTVMYGLIIKGNNLTYANPEVAKEYRDRK